MKIQAMLDWSPEEKSAKVKEWSQSLFTLRLQKATGQLDNPMKIKQLRKDIARLKTAQHMGAAEVAAAAAAHETAPHAATSEETGSSKVNAAAATPKPKAHAAASGKGAKKRAAAHKKKTAAPAKAHSPSKKSAGPKGKTAGGSKAKSATPKKSKKK